MSRETPILDDNVIADLRESVGGDDAFVIDLASTYLAEGPEHLRALEEAVAAADVAAAVRPAHTLKSSSASLGAMRLSEISRGIEHAAREGQVDGLGDAVAEAKAAWLETVAQMRERGMTT
jgi:HPt (histidine-containing phosphotransfer) domain-containing protein